MKQSVASSQLLLRLAVPFFLVLAPAFREKVHEYESKEPGVIRRTQSDGALYNRPTLNTMRMKVQGHRGYGHNKPHNSLAAFIAAGKDPFVTSVEFDVRRTMDGVLVISHGWEQKDIVVFVSPSTYAALSLEDASTGKPTIVGMKAQGSLVDKLLLGKTQTGESVFAEIGDQILDVQNAGSDLLRILFSKGDSKPVELMGFSQVRQRRIENPPVPGLPKGPSDETVPTLEQVVNVCSAYKLAMNVELKIDSGEHLDEIIMITLRIIGGERFQPPENVYDRQFDALTNNFFVDQSAQANFQNVRISSFSRSVIQKVRTVSPQMPVGQLFNNGPAGEAPLIDHYDSFHGIDSKRTRPQPKLITTNPVAFYRDPLPANFHRDLQPGDSVHLCAETVSPEDVKRAHDRRLSVLVWFPGQARSSRKENKQTMIALQEMGVDVVCTNYPQIWQSE